MGFVATPSAWLAGDHILIIGGSRFNETYQRVYLKDIRALILRKKTRFIFQWPYLFLIPALVTLLSSVLATRQSAGVVAFGLLLLVIGIGFATAQFGCVLYLNTAVGNVMVRSVASRITARRFIAAVTPVIESAQTRPPETT